MKTDETAVDIDPLADAATRIVKATIRPNELRLIGRFVRLDCGGLTYVGLVSFITKDTVVLVDVLQMTAAQANVHLVSKSAGRSRRQRGNRGGRTAVTTTDPYAPHEAATPARQQAAPFGDEPSGTSEPPDLLPPILLPNVTFNRRKISCVEFAEDHKKSFDGIADVDGTPREYRARVFVRRFVVHTNQGNNPDKIELINFMKNRTGHVFPPATLLAFVVEEIAALEKIDVQITDARRAAANQPQASTTRGARDARMRLPDRVLSRSGIPSQTAYMAIAHAILALASLIFCAIAFTSVDRNVVSDFLSVVFTWIIITCVLQLLLSTTSGFHAFKMSIVTETRASGFRVFFLVVGSTVIALVTVMVSLCAYQYVSLGGTSLERHYSNIVFDDPNAICLYNARFECSGYSTPCVTQPDLNYCPIRCNYLTDFNSTVACEGILKKQVQNVAQPLAIILYCACLVVLYDWKLLSSLNSLSPPQ